jgi:hypothetical protein
MRKLLDHLGDALTREESEFIAALIDANEPGIALEELSATLAKGREAAGRRDYRSTSGASERRWGWTRTSRTRSSR